MSIRAYKIAILCAHALNISPRELFISKKGKARTEISDARFICYHFIKNETNLNLAQIARMFKKSNHTCILYGLKQFQNLTFRNVEFQEKIFECDNAISIYNHQNRYYKLKKINQKQKNINR